MWQHLTKMLGTDLQNPLYALIMMADHKTAKSATLTSVAPFMPLAMQHQVGAHSAGCR